MRAPKSVRDTKAKLENLNLPETDASLYLEAKKGNQKAKLDWNRQATAYNTAVICQLGEKEAQSVLKVVFEGEMTKEEVIDAILGGNHEVEIQAANEKGNFETLIADKDGLNSLKYEVYYDYEVGSVKNHTFYFEDLTFCFPEIVGGWFGYSSFKISD